MTPQKIDIDQLKVGDQFTINERTTGKIIFQTHNIKASICKTPAQVIENDAFFGYGSVWKILNLENNIYKLQEIGTPLQRYMTKKSLEILLKSQQ